MLPTLANGTDSISQTLDRSSEKQQAMTRLASICKDSNGEYFEGYDTFV